MRPGNENGGVVNALIIMFIGVSVAVAPDTGPTEAEREQRQTCSPIQWDESAGPEWEAGWDQLRATGWIGRADDGMDAIYPPGCESVTP